MFTLHFNTTLKVLLIFFNNLPTSPLQESKKPYMRRASQSAKSFLTLKWMGFSPHDPKNKRWWNFKKLKIQVQRLEITISSIFRWKGISAPDLVQKSISQMYWFAWNFVSPACKFFHVKGGTDCFSWFAFFLANAKKNIPIWVAEVIF